MAAFFFGGQLVLEMNAGRTRLNHSLHQLIGVERAAEPGLGIGNDRRHPVSAVIALRMGDLIDAAQRVVDAPDHVRDRIHGVQRLIGVHLSRCVRVGGNLPAGEIDRPRPGLDLLHRLVAGQGAKRRDIRLGFQQVPESRGTHFGQRVTNSERSGEPLDIGRAVVAPDAGEALATVGSGMGKHRLSPVLWA